MAVALGKSLPPSPSQTSECLDWAGVWARHLQTGEWTGSPWSDIWKSCTPDGTDKLGTKKKMRLSPWLTDPGPRLGRGVLGWKLLLGVLYTD